MGGFVGLTHNWSSSVSSGLYYGWAENDFEDSAKAAFPDHQPVAPNAPRQHLVVARTQRCEPVWSSYKGWRETNDDEKGRRDAPASGACV